MNKSEVIFKVAEKSGVSLIDCEKVLKAFEEILSDELNHSKGKAGVFDKVYTIMSFLHSKKTKI